MQNDNLVALVQSFQQLMSTKQLDAALQLVDTKAVWHSDEIGAPWSGIHHGMAAIREHFNNISGTTTNFERSILEIFSHKNLVIEIGSLSCTPDKTGQPFATEYVCLYGIENNKIISYRIFEDSLKLYRAYFSSNIDGENLSLQFNSSVANMTADEMVKVIKAAEIEKNFPASAPGAVSILDVNSMSIGMVKTADHPSYPHSNDYDEVHYVLQGTAKFKQNDAKVFEIEAGDVVFVKSPEKHEWFDCSSDFKLVFVQAKKIIL